MSKSFKILPEITPALKVDQRFIKGKPRIWVILDKNMSYY